MIHVDKETHYSFHDFLAKRDRLQDLQNPFLLAVLEQFVGEQWDKVQQQLLPFSDNVSNKWRKYAEEIAKPSNHPTILHFDAYNRRIDRIVRPLESTLMTHEVFGEKLFSPRQHVAIGMIKKYLLHGNGELGITCPVACTDGLVALIEQFYNEVPAEVKNIYEHVTEGIDGQLAIGAQYMSEIQGGSNIPANVLKAVVDGEHYRLYGNKFFCSAVHADYAVVTARIDTSEEVAVFIVPSWLPGNKEKEIRNSFHINRLKRKIGTMELPSGEIEYNGAVAYKIGPANRGVSLAVSIVLTRSRLDIAFASGAFLMRAAREARIYTEFREVFGRSIAQFPMAAAQLEDIEDAAKRTVATAFEIYKQFMRLDELTEIEAFAIRELILLQKIFVTKETVDQLRLAISLFGGHGAIEDFSALPRLFRDSLVNELWEGPRNVLLAQVYRDLLKSQWPLQTFLQTMFNQLNEDEAQGYADRLTYIMQAKLLDLPTALNKVAAREWESIWEELFYKYQLHILNSYPELPILDSKDV